MFVRRKLQTDICDGQINSGGGRTRKNMDGSEQSEVAKKIIVKSNEAPGYNTCNIEWPRDCDDGFVAVAIRWCTPGANGEDTK